MNHVNCRRKKSGDNKLFDLSRFDEWFELTYKPVNCGGLPVPKIISFKEHIRILKERDNDYTSLQNRYNELVDDYNKLQKAYCEATGERYVEEGKESDLVNKLTKAKEIIQGLLELPDLIEDRTIEHTELIAQAEAFIKG
ncbi:MAG: hypothetical protein K5751_12550 [Treponemataceae bacterium]|nr:hypothetical protein [Treponemataceae bacterium]